MMLSGFTTGYRTNNNVEGIHGTADPEANRPFSVANRFLNLKGKNRRSGPYNIQIIYIAEVSMGLSVQKQVWL
jgi:hypothetical protein